MAFLEEYLVRRKLGQRGIEGLGAREVEAFLTLEHELIQVNRGTGGGNQINVPTPQGRNA